VIVVPGKKADEDFVLLAGQAWVNNLILEELKKYLVLKFVPDGNSMKSGSIP